MFFGLFNKPKPEEKVDEVKKFKEHRYCSRCGEKMVLISYPFRYDINTGKPISYAYVKHCPYSPFSHDSLHLQLDEFIEDKELSG